MEPLGLVSSLAALFSGVAESPPMQPRDNLAIVQVYESPADDWIAVRYDEAVLIAQDQQAYQPLHNVPLYTDSVPLITAQDIDLIDSGIDELQAVPAVFVSLSEQGVEKVRHLLKRSDDKGLDMQIAFALWDTQLNAENPDIKLMREPITLMGDMSPFPQHFQITGGEMSMEDQQRFLDKIAMPMATDSNIYGD